MCVPEKEENSDFQGPPSALEVWYVKVGVLNKLYTIFALTSIGQK